MIGRTKDHVIRSYDDVSIRIDLEYSWWVRAGSIREFPMEPLLRRSRAGEKNAKCENEAVHEINGKMNVRITVETTDCYTLRAISVFLQDKYLLSVVYGSPIK